MLVVTVVKYPQKWPTINMYMDKFVISFLFFFSNSCSPFKTEASKVIVPPSPRPAGLQDMLECNLQLTILREYQQELRGTEHSTLAGSQW